MAILFIASCVGLVSCNNEEELVAVDVNDYNFYFLVDGKRYNLNDTVYVSHDLITQHSVGVLTEEGVVHIWHPDDESFLDWEYIDLTNYTFKAQRIGSKKLRFVVGNVYDVSCPVKGTENYPYTKNTKNIYLNIVVRPIPDEILKLNMDLYVVNEFEKEVVKDTGTYRYYSTYLRLTANSTTKHICDDFEVLAWGADGNDFIKNNTYPDSNYHGWNPWDKEYAWFDASVRGDVFHVYIWEYWPKEYYIKFRYAERIFRVEREKSSSELVWTIE